MARPGTQEATAELLADDPLLPPLHRGDSGGRSGLGVSGTAWMVESISEGEGRVTAMGRGNIDNGARKSQSIGYDRKALALLKHARYPHGWRRLAIYTEVHNDLMYYLISYLQSGMRYLFCIAVAILQGRSHVVSHTLRRRTFPATLQKPDMRRLCHLSLGFRSGPSSGCALIMAG